MKTNGKKTNGSNTTKTSEAKTRPSAPPRASVETQPARSASTAPAFAVDVRNDGIAVVTFDVPGEAVNSLRADFAREFEALCTRLRDDDRIQGAVLVSGKPDSWIVGADIEVLSACTTAEQVEALARTGKAALAKLREIGKPVVAAIHGPALGGGLEVALRCTARIASDHPKTVVGLPEVQLGLLPGGNGLQLMAERVGLQATLDLALTGKHLRARSAQRMGLIDEVVPEAILRDVAIAWAKRRVVEGTPAEPSAMSKMRATLADPKLLATFALERTPLGRTVLFKKARSMTLARTKGHYPAADKIIDVLEVHAGRGFDASDAVETAAFGMLAVSDVARRLMGIFFATQELKKDNGVSDPGVAPRSVERIGVLGAGLMGAGIAYVSSNAGHGVRIKDRDAAGLGRGMKLLREYYDARVRKHALTSGERDKRMARVTATTDYSGFKNVDLVVEAVFEDLALKHQVLADIETASGPDTILASNTSTLRISKIAEAAKHPERVIGMHYFSPVNKMPLLEVIVTDKTAPWVTATAVAVGRRQGKTVIVVRDGYGFYTSRILAPYMNEAAFLLAAGVAIDTIDAALTDWGFPVGPITLLDEVGIDVAEKAAKVLHEAFGPRLAPPGMFTRVVADGRGGRKNERGFYTYENGKKVVRKGHDVVDESVYALLGVEPCKTVERLEIAERVVLQMIGEAIRCLEEGILRNPRDGDVGAIFGLGFPPFRGGPFAYADDVGPQKLLARFRAFEAEHGQRWAPPALLVENARTGKRFHDAKPARRGETRRAVTP